MNKVTAFHTMGNQSLSNPLIRQQGGMQNWMGQYIAKIQKMLAQGMSWEEIDIELALEKGKKEQVMAAFHAQNEDKKHGIQLDMVSIAAKKAVGYANFGATGSTTPLTDSKGNKQNNFGPGFGDDDKKLSDKKKSDSGKAKQEGDPNAIGMEQVLAMLKKQAEAKDKDPAVDDDNDDNEVVASTDTDKTTTTTATDDAADDDETVASADTDTKTTTTTDDDGDTDDDTETETA